jgi:hypothetical protein
VAGWVRSARFRGAVMAEQLHTIAAMMRVCAQQLAAKIDHEYYGLTPAQRLELRMLPCDMRNWADRIDPGRAPVPDNGSAEITDFAAARARRMGVLVHE